MLKRALFVALSLPLLWLAVRWGLLLSGGEQRILTSDPVDYTINHLGEWGLRILLLALAITPIRRLTGWTAVMQVRRMVGLFAFAYVLIHLLVYYGLDLAFSLDALWRDVVKRRYILFGMAAFVLLVPLAVTSTRGWVRRLGGRNWQRLHRLVYAAGVLAVLHFILQVKGRQTEPYVYAAILAVLLLIRLLPRRQRNAAGNGPPARASRRTANEAANP